MNTEKKGGLSWQSVFDSHKNASLRGKGLKVIETKTVAGPNGAYYSTTRSIKVNGKTDLLKAIVSLID